MRVLYVNHTATVSGGERSLLDLLGALRGREVQARLAAPDGALQDRARALGVPCTSIAGTSGSLRLHPLHTPAALAEMTLAAAQVSRAAARHEIELLHANSIRAGIVLGLSHRSPIPGLRLRRGVGSIVHVRDCLPPGAASRATMRLIAATASTVIANSAYTAASVRALAPAARVRVVHNPVDLARFDPDALDRASARARLGEDGRRRVLLGVVAQLSPWKGQDTAIEALGALRRRGIDAQLLLIGSAKFVDRATRFDNEAYVSALHELARREGVAERVSWLGEREDVPALMRALDVLLLPSWEEPFGRAVIEAMALEVPVIATDVGGPAEIVSDGRDGYLRAPRDAAAWAQAVELLVDDPARARAFGAAGRLRVERQFTLERHVQAMLEVYSAVHSEVKRRL